MANVRPSDVYTYCTKEKIKNAIQRDGWKVVAFRAPVHGETFVALGGGITDHYHNYYPDPGLESRLILEKRNAY